MQDYTRDTLNIKNRNNQNAHDAVINLKEELDLIDPWREENPESRIYTWHNQQNKQSRLDYFLLSSDTSNFIESTVIKPGYRTDHSIIEITLEFKKQQNGRGLWKFNNSLLKDTKYCEEIKECIKNTKQFYKRNGGNLLEENPDSYFISSQLLFDVMKLGIRGKTIAYATSKKRDNNRQENQLDRKIDNLH